MMRQTLILLFSFLCLPAWTWAQGIIVNEVSNGASGVQEYIELLVVGSAAAPTAAVNLGGWVIDDNNGDFEGSTGTGVAAGHFRIASGCLSAVPVGSLVVIYNANDRDPRIPADDPTDANNDGVYIIPHTNACLEVCAANPNTTFTQYTGCTYNATTLTGATSWSALGLANSGDAAQVRRPDYTFYHGFSYGVVDNAPFPSFPAAFGGGLAFNVTTASGSARAPRLDCGNWTQASNYDSIAASINTPGAANTSRNATLIQNLRNNTNGAGGSFDYANLNNPNNCLPFTAPSLNLGNDTLYCSNFARALTAPAGMSSYQWSTGATTQSITASSAGTYSVTITDGLGNQQRDTIVFTQSAPPPAVFLGNDTTYCSAFSRTLTSPNGTGFTRLWSTGDTTQSITVSNAGAYSVQLSNVCGTSADTIVFQQFTTITGLNLGNDTTYCGAFSRTLFAPSGGQYRWNNGSTTQVLIIAAAGTYAVTVTNACDGTSLVDSIVLTRINPPSSFDLGADTALCNGQQLAISAPSGAFLYQWSDGSTAQTITATAQGLYTVTVSNQCGSRTDSLRVVPPLGIQPFTLGADTSFCGDISFPIAVPASSNGVSFQWSNGATTQSITATTAAVYSVTATDRCGASQNNAIRVDSICGDYVMPSGFTPNDDSANDRFRPIRQGSGVALKRLVVYNRWGQRVFETSTETESWDGSYNGQAQPRDVYLYELEYTRSNETLVKRGEVTLLR